MAAGVGRGVRTHGGRAAGHGRARRRAGRRPAGARREVRGALHHQPGDRALHPRDGRPRGRGRARRAPARGASARDRPGRRRRRRPGRRRPARRGPAGGRRCVRAAHAPLAVHRRLRRPGRVPARPLQEPQARAQAAAQPHGRGRDRRVRRPRRPGGPSRAARRGVAAGGQGVEARGGLGGALLAHRGRVLRRRRALGGRGGPAAAGLPAPVRTGDRVRVLLAVRVHAVVPQARHGRRPRQARAGGRAHPTFDRLRLRGSGAA